VQKRPSNDKTGDTHEYFALLEVKSQQDKVHPTQLKWIAALADSRACVGFVHVVSPSLKSVRDLLYKRGCAKINGQRVALLHAPQTQDELRRALREAFGL
jgi:hypothetical protein